MKTPQIDAIPGTSPLGFKPLAERLAEPVKMVAKKAKRPKRHRTNVEMVRDMMNFSHFGPMAQLWIMDTLAKEAKRQADAGVPNWPEDSFVNAQAWHGTACEIHRKLSEAGYR